MELQYLAGVHTSPAARLLGAVLNVVCCCVCVLTAASPPLPSRLAQQSSSSPASLHQQEDVQSMAWQYSACMAALAACSGIAGALLVASTVVQRPQVQVLLTQIGTYTCGTALGFFLPLALASATLDALRFQDVVTAFLQNASSATAMTTMTTGASSWATVEAAAAGAAAAAAAIADSDDDDGLLVNNNTGSTVTTCATASLLGSATDHNASLCYSAEGGPMPCSTFQALLLLSQFFGFCAAGHMKAVLAVWVGVLCLTVLNLLPARAVLFGLPYVLV
jgi:hypothetical protein